MEFESRRGSSNDEQQVSQRSNNTQIVRHTSEQIQGLEKYYQEFQFPNEEQQLHISQEFGLEVQQVKYWFQNKRNYMRIVNQREENNLIRAENERLLSENLAMEELLKNPKACTCMTKTLQELELELENQALKKECERILKHPYFSLGSSSSDSYSAEDKRLMIEAVKNAFEELRHLLLVNSIWLSSPNRDEDQYVLRRDSYDELFLKARQLGSSTSRFEATKASILVRMPAKELTKLLVDPSQWADLFPTIVTGPKSYREMNDPEHGHTWLLMHSKFHVLSPLVAAREFRFIKFHVEMDDNAWLVGNFSYDCSQVRPPTPPRTAPCWMLPSGCLIQDVGDGMSKVTWVEHIEVDDEALTHHLFKDLVSSSQAYGAKRCLLALHRTCERIEYGKGIGPTVSLIFDGVRIHLMLIAERMVKTFYAMLSLPEEDTHPFAPLIHEDDDMVVRVFVQKNTSASPALLPQGTNIITGAASFWLPTSCKTLYEFFRDETNRPKWDVMALGVACKRTSTILTGDKGNMVSVFRHCTPHDNSKTFFLQEGFIDSLGAAVVYTPFEQEVMDAVNQHIDTSAVPILPSGITISTASTREMGSSSSSSSGAPPSVGSLVTVVLHALISKPGGQGINIEAMEMLHNHLTSIVEKIKAACQED